MTHPFPSRRSSDLIEKAENLLFVIFRQFGAFGAATNRKYRVWMEGAVLDTSGPKRFVHLPGGAPHHTNVNGVVTIFGDLVEPGLHLTGPALLSNRDLLFIIRDLGGRNLACGKQTPELGGAHGIGCQNRIIAEPIESAWPRPSAEVKRADFRQDRKSTSLNSSH